MASARNPFTVPVLMTRTIGAPHQMNTSFKLGLSGYMTAGAASGQAIIIANGAYEPFGSTNPLTSGWASLNLTNGSSTTGVPAGWSFYSGAFRQCRVRSSRLTITAVSSGGLDTFNLWIVPLPANSAVAANYMQSQGMAGFQNKMVSAGMRPQTLTSVGQPWQILGFKTPQDYLDATATLGSVTANPGSSALSVWQVSYATLDGTAMAGNAFFDFVIEMNVDFQGAVELLL